MHYSHQDHAGNFADVHKHWLLCLLFKQCLASPEPLTYLETHAGAGLYRNSGGDDNGFSSGIARLWPQRLDVPSIEDYRHQVTALNPDGILNTYPGSPYIAGRKLRPEDRGVLVEKAPTTFARLVFHLGSDPRFTTIQGDGPSTITEHLPASKRYLMLVDPPFTDQNEYGRMAEWLPGLFHHTHGSIALWYPLTHRQQYLPMMETLCDKITTSTLLSEFQRQRPAGGMFGSGMLIFNPPSSLAEQVAQDGPRLAAIIGCAAKLEA